MRRLAIFILILFTIAMFSDLAEARGRSGSRRVYHGRGKGSFYVGGY